MNLICHRSPFLFSHLGSWASSESRGEVRTSRVGSTNLDANFGAPLHSAFLAKTQKNTLELSQ
jgi:hypothetical protein